MTRSMTEVLQEIDQINALCRALRKGYLKHHPDAPLSASELEKKALWAELRRKHPDKCPPEGEEELW